MRKISVYVPDPVYKVLRKLVEEKKVKSMSEFIRNVLVLYLEFGGNGHVSSRPNGTSPRLSPIPRPPSTNKPKRPEERGLIGYGAVHAELIAQLKAVLKKRAERKMRIGGIANAGLDRG